MLPPDTVLQGRYSVVRPLGSGGMGSVYLARDARFHNTVALKETRFPTGELRQAFEREALLLRHLKHPALPGVIDFFEEGGAAYLVMDFVPGEDMSSLLEAQGGRPLPPAQVVAWGCDVLAALAYLHAHNPPILHRDVKPHNIKLTPQGRVVLLDFGLAKGFAHEMSRLRDGESVQAYTPHYAALEQVQGTGTTARSDLYSVGATLYHLATGVVPPDSLRRAMASVAREPDPLIYATSANPQVPRAMADVLALALALSPADRFATAEEFGRALRAALVETVPLNPGPTTPMVTVLADPLRTRGDTVVETNAPRASAPRLGRALGLGLGALALVVLAVTVSVVAWLVLADEEPAAPASNQPAPAVQPSKSATRATAPAQLLVGHGAHIVAVAWSPDGHSLASASYDKTVKVWGASGQLLMTFVHPDQPTCVAWEASGKEVASGSDDGKVRVWNVAVGAVRVTLAGHTDRVLKVAWAPAAYALVSAGADGTVRLWDTKGSGQPIRTLTGHSRYVTCLAWSPDRQTLASGDTDGAIKLWDGFTGLRLKDLEPYPNDLYALAWSPDGRFLATGGEASVIVIYDVSSGRRVNAFRGHTERIRTIAWSPDGKTLASYERDSRDLFLWNAETGELRERIMQPEGEPIALAWSPDGTTLAVGCSSGTIKLLRDVGALAP